MGWLGLDWGNVPSWFSALSFSATALIIWRDRKHRLRRQIEDVGIWVKVDVANDSSEADTETCIRLISTVFARNAANLPIEILSVRYVVRYQLWNVADDINPSHPRLPGGHIDCKVHGSVVPPGETLEFEDFPIRLDYDKKVGIIAVGPPYPGNRVDIIGISARDAAGRKWEISPRQERGPVQVPDILVPFLDANKAIRYSLRVALRELGYSILANSRTTPVASTALASANAISCGCFATIQNPFRRATPKHHKARHLHRGTVSPQDAAPEPARSVPPRCSG